MGCINRCSTDGTEGSHHMGQLSCFAFSSDGMQIVSGSFDNFVRVWDRGYTKSGTLPKCGSVTHDVKVDTSTKMCHTSEKVQHIVGSSTHLGVLHFSS